MRPGRAFAAVAVLFGIVAGLTVFATPEGDVVNLPLLAGEVTGLRLEDGTPVYAVRHRDGRWSVVDGVSTHHPYGPLKLVGWCPSARVFEDVQHGSLFDEYGRYMGGPAPTDLPLYSIEVTDESRGVLRIGERRPPGGRDGPASSMAGPTCAVDTVRRGGDELGLGGAQFVDEAPYRTVSVADAAASELGRVSLVHATVTVDESARLCESGGRGSRARPWPVVGLAAAPHALVFAGHFYVRWNGSAFYDVIQLPDVVAVHAAPTLSACA